MNRKGVWIDYNYLVLILMFFVVFSTGLSFASESVPNVDSLTGVTPPNEVSACEPPATQKDVWYRKGTEDVSWNDGLPSSHIDVYNVWTPTIEQDESGDWFIVEDVIDYMSPEEGDRLAKDEPRQSLRITSAQGITGNYYIEQPPILGGRESYFDLYGKVQVEKMKFYSWTPPGTEIKVILRNLENVSEPYTYTITPDRREDYIGETTINLDEIQVNGENVVVNPDTLEIEFNMSKLRSDFVSPRLHTVRMYGSHLTVDEGWIGQSLRTGKCMIAQLFNLFNIVTLQTGYFWIDMFLVPFQIILLMFIGKLIAHAVSSLPFT